LSLMGWLGGEHLLNRERYTRAIYTFALAACAACSIGSLGSFFGVV
jgi:hypothetical protein